MVAQLPYCGTPPAPDAILLRFNLDPILIAILVAAALVHLRSLRGRASARTALPGWVVTACALVSPLCALSVSLFSARVAQHMVLILVAAPLLALALPAFPEKAQRPCLWLSVMTFFIALWFWHMPPSLRCDVRLDARLLGDARDPLWQRDCCCGARCCITGASSSPSRSLVAGALTSMQMGFLGAVLATRQPAPVLPAS